MKKELPKKIFDHKLALKLADNKYQLAKEMFEMLIACLPKHQNELDEAFQKQDLKELLMATHKLHGAVCYSGTPRLTAAIYQLESALKTNNTKEIKKLYQQVIEEIYTVLENAAPGFDRL